MTTPLDTLLELAAIDHLEPADHLGCEWDQCAACMFTALAPIARKAIEDRDRARAQLQEAAGGRPG